MRKITLLIVVSLCHTLSMAQTDTLGISFRGKDVAVTSNEDGSGGRVITLDDGVRKTRVQVDFNVEESHSESKPLTESYQTVRRHAFSKKIEKKLIYKTLNFRLGFVLLSGLRPESKVFLDDSLLGFNRNRQKNRVLMSKYHALNWGLDIPTKFDRINVTTGIGLAAQKIHFDNARFRLREISEGYVSIDRYAHDSILQRYDLNSFIYTSSINVPISVKFRLRKKNRFFVFGLNNRFQFSAKNSINNQYEQSFLGITYVNRNKFARRVNNNFQKYALDASMTYGKGLLSVFAMANVTPMFTRDFYRREDGNQDERQRSFHPISLRFGMQINIW